MQSVVKILCVSQSRQVAASLCLSGTYAYRGGFLITMIVLCIIDDRSITLQGQRSCQHSRAVTLPDLGVG
jgi:hypothetical protein